MQPELEEPSDYIVALAQIRRRRERRRLIAILLNDLLVCALPVVGIGALIVAASLWMSQQERMRTTGLASAASAFGSSGDVERWLPVPSSDTPRFRPTMVQP
jgi:hypothetical protein